MENCFVYLYICCCGSLRAQHKKNTPHQSCTRRKMKYPRPRVKICAKNVNTQKYIQITKWHIASAPPPRHKPFSSNISKPRRKKKFACGARAFWIIIYYELFSIILCMIFFVCSIGEIKNKRQRNITYIRQWVRGAVLLWFIYCVFRTSANTCAAAVSRYGNCFLL